MNSRKMRRIKNLYEQWKNFRKLRKKEEKLCDHPHTDFLTVYQREKIIDRLFRIIGIND